MATEMPSVTIKREEGRIYLKCTDSGPGGALFFFFFFLLLLLSPPHELSYLLQICLWEAVISILNSGSKELIPGLC